LSELEGGEDWAEPKRLAKVAVVGGLVGAIAVILLILLLLGRI
jgi:hypothetical protein